MLILDNVSSAAPTIRSPSFIKAISFLMLSQSYLFLARQLMIELQQGALAELKAMKGAAEFNPTCAY